MPDSNIKLPLNYIPKNYDKWKRKNWYYYQQIKNFYSKSIPKDKRVLELGCGTGEILNCVKPIYAVGLDISEEMTAIAKNKFPDLKFLTRTAEEPCILKDKFEYIIMCDLLDHVSDIWDVFKSLENLTEDNAKVIITTVNPAWDSVFFILEKLKMKMPEGPHNFLFRFDIINLLKLFGYEIEQDGAFLLLPAYIPLISGLFNCYLSRLPLIRDFCLVQYIIAKRIKREVSNKDLSCSVIIPCFNEADNIEECVKRIPSMGKFTEIILINDGSTDLTKEKMEKAVRENKNVSLISYSPNRGKAYAVRQGFDVAKGDILMTLDADIAVSPEELERFFWAISEQGVDFVNGTRMIYPMEEQSMRTLNRLGNKIFGTILTWLIGQKISDTLCGTKAILREHWNKMPRTNYDSWGDFDLLLGAAKLNLRIVEMPVRYKRRLKGLSKMKPFKHGFILFIRCLIGFKELKLTKWLQNIAYQSAGQKNTT